MRKFMLATITCLLLTGCGNDGTLNCTREFNDEENYLIKDEMVIEYKNDIVTKVINTNITEADESMIDLTVSFGEIFASNLNKIKGFNLVYSKEDDTHVKYIMTVDYENLNIDKLKEQFGDDFDEDLYASNKIKIKDFKKSNLSDYKCK